MTKERKINISMDSVKRNGRDVSVLSIGKKEIGYIEPDGAKFNAVEVDTDLSQNFKTEDEAVNFLIANYHLHQA